MPWPISWLDLDSEAAARAGELLDGLLEAETIDQLGLGVFRDAVSERFFPATSTIMTRAKYFFLVPAAFERLRGALERDPKSLHRDSALRDKLREIERSQAEALMSGLKSGDPRNSGIIGWTVIRKGDGFVANPPSNIYWSAIRALRMVNFDGSSSGYRRMLLGAGRSQKDDEGKSVDDEIRWDPELPTAVPPRGSIALSLSREESKYLRDKYRSECSNSLFSLLLGQQKWGESFEKAKYPWQLPKLESPWKEEVSKAKCLSALIHGANLVYNHLLSKLLGEEFAATARGDLGKWLANDAGHGVASAMRTDFGWVTERVGGSRHSDARKFLRTFQVIHCRARTLVDFESRECRRFFEEREYAVKPTSARLLNEAARKGVEELGGRGSPDYRWSTARALLSDIYEGLG